MGAEMASVVRVLARDRVGGTNTGWGGWGCWYGGSARWFRGGAVMEPSSGGRGGQSACV